MPWKIEWTVTEGTTVRVERESVPTDKRHGDRAQFAENIATAADAAGLVSVTATRHPADELPPPMGEEMYSVIAAEFRAGNVVPFLGAGASFCVRGHDEGWSLGADFPPSATELAEHLGKLSQYRGTSPQDCSDLARIASHFSQKLGRRVLATTLRSILLPNADGGQPAASRPVRPRQTPHWLLAKMVAKLQKPMLIVTTNYDRLVENAFKEEGRTDFDIVVHSTIRAYANCVLFRRGDATSEDFEPVALGELSRRIDLKKRTVIYKMHGSVSVNRDWDSFVINEEDYVDFLGRMNKTEPVIPPIFTTYFREKSFLFLGYSLRDWNLRIVLHNLQLEDAFDDNRHWAIQYYPTLAERELWDKRKVSIFHVELLAFVRRLATEFGLPPADENGSGQ